MMCFSACSKAHRRQQGAPKGPIRTQDEHQKGSRRALGRALRTVSSRHLFFPSHVPLHLPLSTHHHHHHLRSHFGSRSIRTVSVVETLVVEPWSTNVLAAAQRGVAGSDDSVLGQRTRGSPSRWHWPRRSTTTRRSGGATRRGNQHFLMLWEQRSARALHSIP